MGLNLTALLGPISAAAPAGESIRYTEVQRELRELHKAQLSAPLDEGGQPISGWEGDWDSVLEAAARVLSEQSKDLEVAVILTEAAIRVHGFPGLRDALLLLNGLHERFWEDFYPLLDEDGAEARSGCLEVLKQPRIAPLIRSIPLTGSFEEEESLGWHDWEAMRKRGGGSGSSPASGVGNRPELFEELMARTSREAPEELRAIVLSLEESQHELTRLEGQVAERYGRDALAFPALGSALEDCIGLVGRWRSQVGTAERAEVQVDGATKGEGHLSAVEGSRGEADRAATVSSPEETDSAPFDLSAVSVASDGLDLWSDDFSSELDSNPDGVLLGLIERWRMDRPTSPVSYTLLRGFRWGQLWGTSRSQRLGGLQGPGLEARVALRRCLLARDWERLLMGSERALARLPFGGWLDLQFYTAKALEALGGAYATVLDAVVRSTLALVGSFPELLEAELVDGSPVASLSVQNWLEGVASQCRSSLEPELEWLFGAQDNPQLRGEASVRLGLALNRASQGNVGEALALLHQALDASASGKERFLAQLELAEFCLEIDQTALARPILVVLYKTAEERNLETWEPPVLSARLWSAIWRCQQHNTQGPPVIEPGALQRIMERLCRLDPQRALERLDSQGGNG